MWKFMILAWNTIFWKAIHSGLIYFQRCKLEYFGAVFLILQLSLVKKSVFEDWVKIGNKTKGHFHGKNSQDLTIIML